MTQSKLKSFKDLIVWKKSADLAVCVYRASENFPKSEIYGLTNQMRRATISISSNIAEGFKRVHRQEKLQFYNVAHASVSEVESQLEIARRLSFVSDNLYKEIQSLLDEISRMMNSLIVSTNNTKKVSGLKTVLILAFILYSLSSILYPNAAMAAALYFVPEETKIGFDGVVEYTLYLDSIEGVNALETTITFPANLLELREISDGNSIVSLWVRRPAAVDDKPGEIFLSGVIPGGFKSKEGKVISLRFVTKSPGEGAIGFRDTLAYENDGEGTEALLDARPAHITVTSERAEGAALLPEDFTAPEEFTPVVARDPNIFEGKWFVSFVTQDKGSGIAMYEVLESGRRYRVRDGRLMTDDELAWVETESPYELKDQERKSYVYVRAVDNRGNSRVEVLSPQRTVAEFARQVIIVLIVLIAALYIYRRRRGVADR